MVLSYCSYPYIVCTDGNYGTGLQQAAQRDGRNQQVLYEYAIMRFIYEDKDWSNPF